MPSSLNEAPGGHYIEYIGIPFMQLMSCECVPVIGEPDNIQLVTGELMWVSEYAAHLTGKA